MFIQAQFKQELQFGGFCHNYINAANFIISSQNSSTVFQDCWPKINQTQYVLGISKFKILLSKMILVLKHECVEDLKGINLEIWRAGGWLCIYI